MEERSQKHRIWLLAAALTLAVGCGKEFQYDLALEKCVNSEGEAGFNEGGFVECGRVEGRQTQNLDLSNRNLRGLTVIDSFMDGTRFDGSDLTGAYFVTTRLWNISLRNTKLIHTVFNANPQSIFIGEGGFEGAVFDFDAVLHVPIYSLIQDGAALLDSEKQVASDFAGYRLGIDFHDEVLPIENKLIQHDYSEIHKKYGFRVDRDSWFANFYGGTTSQSILDYVDERVGTIQPSLIRHSRLSPLGASNPTGLILRADLFDSLTQTDYYLSDLRSYLYRGSATPKLPELHENAKRFTGILPLDAIDEAKDGIVSLGPAYTSMGLRTVQRIVVWAHEARHSDCPEPHSHDGEAAARSVSSRISNLTAEVDALVESLRGYVEFIGDEPANQLEPKLRNQLEDRFRIAERDLLDIRIRSDQIGGMKLVSTKKGVHLEPTSFGAMDRSCNHLHAVCPKLDYIPRALWGKPACDDSPWGSYFASGLHADAIADHCDDCNELDRQIAMIMRDDHFNRILILDELIDGEHGKPSAL